MKRIASDDNRLVLEIGRREKLLLDELLGLFPLVPVSHHKVTRESTQDPRLAEAQSLLDQALTERKKKSLDRLWFNPDRFSENKGRFRVAFTSPEIEWFLQVLNDVRVGSWIQLGSPGPKELPSIPATAQAAKYYLAMEACAHFQLFLIAALEKRV